MTKNKMWQWYFLTLLLQNQSKVHKTVTIHQLNPSLNQGKVLVGYWIEGIPAVDLGSIPKDYNVVIVAFLEEVINGIPFFEPKYMSEEEFISDVNQLKAAGQVVLISLGGAFGRIAIKQEEKEVFKTEMIKLIDKYGFMGVDIDLETTSVNAADNQRVIPEVLKEIKDYYKSQGKDFAITMAPEFIYLRGADALYRPYVQGLEGYYDLIFPQYYNQGDDGIWSDEYNMFLSQSDDEHKAEFLYTLTHAIVTGTQDYIKIPADKFAIGLPASPHAAINGYVQDPEDVQWALNRLAEEGLAIRGLMTWSINHDSVNEYRFMNDYAPIVFGREGEPNQAAQE